MKYFDMKVVGYERVSAESEGDAYEYFDRLCRERGHKVFDLSWISVQAFADDGETSEDEVVRLVRELKKQKATPELARQVKNLEAEKEELRNVLFELREQMADMRGWKDSYVLWASEVLTKTEEQS